MGKPLVLNLPPGPGAAAATFDQQAPALPGFEAGDLMLGGLDEQDDDVEALQVENILSKLIKKRKEGTQQKQQTLVADVHAKVKGSAEALQSAIAKEAKDQLAASQAAMSKVEGNLGTTIKNMEACTEKYQQEMQQLWKTYSEQYDQLKRIKSTIKASTEKRRSSLKRKIDVLKDESNKAVAEVEGRLQKLRASSSKLPGVLQALQSLMEGST